MFWFRVLFVLFIAVMAVMLLYRHSAWFRDCAVCRHAETAFWVAYGLVFFLVLGIVTLIFGPLDDEMPDPLG